MFAAQAPMPSLDPVPGQLANDLFYWMSLLLGQGGAGQRPGYHRAEVPLNGWPAATALSPIVTYSHVIMVLCVHSSAGEWKLN